VGVTSLRKPLPYDFEFIPTRNGVAITNTTAWNQRDFLVSWGEAGGNIKASMLMKGALNHCVIEGLAGGKTYAFRLRRSDLKGRLLYLPYTTAVTVSERVPTYVVLVGASVGKTWDLPSLPGRTGIDDFAFGYRAKYGYDKGDIIEGLTGAQLKPEMVIIKECAAYFPKELEPIREKLPHWVDSLTTNGIIPVLATCCPVTKANDEQNPGRQTAIDEFNAFVRTYARENQLRLLDLAQALQISNSDSHLRSDCAQPDGLHLTSKAYAALDLAVVPALSGNHLRQTQRREDPINP